ncbi:MAG: AI-2E family transporter [Candidatus Margulisiibacteriota bacterium]
MSRKQIIKVSAFVFFIVAIYLIRGALLPIVLSIALFYILNPITDLIEKIFPSKMPGRRDISICGSFAIFIFVILLAVEFVFPQLFVQTSNFISNFPNYLKYVADSMISGRQWYVGSNLPHQFDVAIFDAIKQTLGSFVAFSQNIVTNLLGLLGQFVGLLITPIIVYFMLRERAHLFEGVNKLLPLALKEPVRGVFEKTDIVLKTYVQNQLLICSMVGLVTWIILYLFGVPFSLILGIIVAVTELIPVIGPIIGGIPIAVIVLAVSPANALTIIALYAALQFIAGNIIAPKIMGDKLGIHPLTVILGVLILGNIIGVWGVFFAAPIIAILKIIYLEISKS